MQAAIGQFNLIQNGTHLRTGKRAVIEKGDEFLDRLLEIRRVLPQSVVGIDDEVLASRVHGPTLWHRSRTRARGERRAGAGTQLKV